MRVDDTLSRKEANRVRSLELVRDNVITVSPGYLASLVKPDLALSLDRK